MEKQHFRIKDRRIAMAMIHSGVRLAPKEEGGPIINSYTPDFLRSIGLLPRNPVSLIEFERAVIEAKRRKKPGTITYLFIRDGRFMEFWTTWRAMEKTAKEAARKNVRPDFGKTVRTVEELTREAYIRLAGEAEMDRDLPWTQDCTCDATSLTFKPETFDLPDAQVKALADAYGGRIPFGETTGHGKRWTLGLDNASRAQLGIHPRQDQ